MVLFYLLGNVSLGHGQKVRVFTEPLAPVHFEQGDQVKGIATEIVQTIFAEAGLEPLIEVYPWKRAYHLALSTEGSFVFTINRTEQRESLFKWVGPILAKNTSLYKLRDRQDIEITVLDDARKYSTAVILGHSLTEQLLENGFREGVELVTTPDKEVQIKVFLKGRSDLITGNQYTMYQALKSQGYSLADVVPVLLVSTDGYYLGANKNVDNRIIEQLNLANDKVQSSGMVEKAIEKYLQ